MILYNSSAIINGVAELFCYTFYYLFYHNGISMKY